MTANIKGLRTISDADIPRMTAISPYAFVVSC
jgi:hypothetical protein